MVSLILGDAVAKISCFPIRSISSLGTKNHPIRWQQPTIPNVGEVFETVAFWWGKSKDFGTSATSQVEFPLVKSGWKSSRVLFWSWSFPCLRKVELPLSDLRLGLKMVEVSLLIKWNWGSLWKLGLFYHMGLSENVGLIFPMIASHLKTG